MTPLLVDTSAVVAAFDADHPRSQDIGEILTDGSNELVTCEPVLAETCFLFARGGIPKASLDLLHDVHRGEYRLPLSLAERASAVAKLMKKYADRPMSLADACLVDLATVLKTGRILTLDSDFQVYRWGRNRPFELVIDLD